MVLDITIDVFILLIIAVGIFLGIKLGFVKIIGKPVRFCSSVALAAWLSDPIARTVLVPLLGGPISNQIKGYLIENYPNITPETAMDEIPMLLRFAATALNIDISTLSPESIIESLVDKLALPVIYVICLVLTFILLYFLAKLLISLLLSLINSMFEDGFLSVPNKILGCVFNTLASFVVVWLFTIVFEFVINLPMLQVYTWAQEFDGGLIYAFFKGLNPVDLLLSF